jgi:hypothetical protein
MPISSINVLESDIAWGNIIRISPATPPLALAPPEIYLDNNGPKL